jgi:drug/metabolite transporter (DMT)-like permease
MQDEPLSRARAISLFAIAAVAWGTAWPVTKAILEYAPPLWTSAVRSAIGTVVLFSFSMVRHRLVWPQRGDVPVVLNIAVLHMTVFVALMAVGLQFVPAGRSVLLAYTTPLWVMIGASTFLAETLTPARLGGVALGMSGLVLLFNPLGFDWSDRTALIGNLLVLLSALVWAVSILHVRAHRWVSSPFELVPWQVLLATGLLTVLAAAIEGVPQIVWSTKLVVLLLYGGIVGIAVPYWAIMTVNRSLPATTTSLGLLGVPIVGVVCSAVALHEPITAALLTAMLLIVGGIAVGTMAQSSR